MTNVSDSSPTSYRFADLTLDVARRNVARGGELIELKALFCRRLDQDARDFKCD